MSRGRGERPAQGVGCWGRGTNGDAWVREGATRGSRGHVGIGGACGEGCVAATAEGGERERESVGCPSGLWEKGRPGGPAHMGVREGGDRWRLGLARSGKQEGWRRGTERWAWMKEKSFPFFLGLTFTNNFSYIYIYMK